MYKTINTQYNIEGDNNVTIHFKVSSSYIPLIKVVMFLSISLWCNYLISIDLESHINISSRRKLSTRNAFFFLKKGKFKTKIQAVNLECSCSLYCRVILEIELQVSLCLSMYIRHCCQMISLILSSYIQVRPRQYKQRRHSLIDTPSNINQWIPLFQN